MGGGRNFFEDLDKQAEGLGIKLPKESPQVVAPKTASNPYDDLIIDSATRNGIDPDLIRAQMRQESSFKPNARSKKNAQGLMQLIPATASRFGVTDPYDPKQNIEGGAKYMRFLLDKFGGNVDLALAGYNAGEGAVMKYGNKIPPYRETQDYVKRIRGNYKGNGLLGKVQPQSDPFESLDKQFTSLTGKSDFAFDDLDQQFAALGGKLESPINGEIVENKPIPTNPNNALLPTQPEIEQPTESPEQYKNALLMRQQNLNKDSEEYKRNAVILAGLDKGVTTQLVQPEIVENQTIAPESFTPNSTLSPTEQTDLDLLKQDRGVGKTNFGEEYGGLPKEVKLQDGRVLTQKDKNLYTDDKGKTYNFDGQNITQEGVKSKVVSPQPEILPKGATSDDPVIGSEETPVEPIDEREAEYQRARTITQTARANESDNAESFGYNTTAAMLTQAGYKVQAQDVEEAYKQNGKQISYGGKSYKDVDWKEYVKSKNGQIDFTITKELVEDVLTAKNKRVDTTLAAIAGGTILTDAEAQNTLSTRFDELPQDKLALALEKGQANQNRYKANIEKYQQAESEQIRNNAAVYAAFDMGWLSPKEAEDLANADSEVRRQLEKEERATAFVPDNSAGVTISTVPIQQMRRRTEEEIQAAVKSRLAKIIKDSGSAKAYLDAQNKANKEQNDAFKEYQSINGGGYIFPLVILRNGLKVVPKTIASIAQSVDILGEALGVNPYTFSWDSRPAFERELYKIGANVKKSLESEKDIGDTIARNNWFLTQLPDIVGQGVMQTIVAGKLGTAAGLIAGASQSASDQYDEAVKGNATQGQRLFAALAGGAAAIPDVFLFNKWFKGAGAADRSGFLKNFAEKLFNKFIGSGIAKEEAELLTKATLKGFFGKIIVGGGAPEMVQEFSEDKINDAVAYFTYDPSPERAKELFSVSKKNVQSAIGGFLGGAMGGGTQAVIEKMNYSQIEREVSQIRFGGKEYETPSETKADYVNVVQQLQQSSKLFDLAERYKQNTRLKTQKQREKYREVLQRAQTTYAEAENLKEATDVKTQEILGIETKNEVTIKPKSFTLDDAVQIFKGGEVKEDKESLIKNKPVPKPEDLTNYVPSNDLEIKTDGGDDKNKVAKIPQNIVDETKAEVDKEIAPKIVAEEKKFKVLDKDNNFVTQEIIKPNETKTKEITPSVESSEILPTPEVLSPEKIAKRERLRGKVYRNKETVSESNVPTSTVEDVKENLTTETEVLKVKQPLSRERVENIIAKSPEPNFDKFVSQTIQDFIPLVERRESITPQELADRVAKSHSLDNPQTFIAYSALKNADPNISIGKDLKGVFNRGRFKGNENVANISTTETFKPTIGDTVTYKGEEFEVAKVGANKAKLKGGGVVNLADLGKVEQPLRMASEETAYQPKPEHKSAILQIRKLLRSRVLTSERSEKIVIRPVKNNEPILIKVLAGINIDGDYKVTLDKSAANHMLKQPPQDMGELKINSKDLEMIPDVIDNYDSIENGGKNRMGLETIIHTKRINGHILVVEEVRKGRKELAVVGLRKFKKGSEILLEPNLSTPEATLPNEQIIDENENKNNLRKVATNRTKEDVRLQKDLNERDLFESLPSVESKVDGDSLKLSLEAGEIFRTASSEITGSDLSKEPNISGQFLNPDEVKAYKAELAELASIAKEDGFDSKPIEDLIKNLDEASKENGTVILNVFDDSVKHERFHQIGYLSAGEYNKTLTNRIADFKGFVKANEKFLQKVYDNFFSKHNYDAKSDLDTIVEETATYIATGDTEMLGLSDADLRSAHDFLYNWFSAYEKQNGNLAQFEKFFDETEKAAEIIRGLNEEKTEKERNSVQESKVESGNRGTEKGEVSSVDDEEQKSSGRRLPDERTEKTRLASLPKTLRSYGQDAVDVAYEKYGDREATDDAVKLFQDLGVDGSIKLLDNLKANEQDAQHTILADMVYRTLRESAIDTNNQELLAQSDEFLRNTALKLVQAGRTIRAVQLAGGESLSIVRTAEKIAEEKGESLTPEQLSKLTDMGSQLEQANVEVEKLKRDVRNLKAQKTRLKNKLESNPLTSRKSRRATLVKQKLIADIAKAKQSEVNSALKEAMKLLAGNPLRMVSGNLAPNGKPSNLNPHLYKLVRTDAFKRWFGNSKAVDSNGEPKIFYHGTNQDFEAFSKDEIGSNFNADEHGFFFTDNIRSASTYATSTSYGLKSNGQSNVVPAFISLQNPLVINIDFDPIDHWDNNYNDIKKRIGNHDGVLIIPESGESMAVPFEPNQIKSVFNKGTFDTKDNSILRSVAPAPIDSNLLSAISKFGAIKLVEGIGLDQTYLPAKFKAEIENQFGTSVLPNLNEIYRESLKVRDSWIQEEAQKRRKERASKDADKIGKLAENLSDKDVLDILDYNRDEKRKKDAVERIHRLAGGVFSKKISAELESMIIDVAGSERAAQAASIAAHGGTVKDIQTALKTDALEAKQLFVQGNKIVQDAKEAIESHKTELKQLIADSDKTISDIEFAEKKASEAKAKKQKEVSDELDRLQNNGVGSKLKRAYTSTFDLLRNLTFSGEMSYQMRQGGKFIRSEAVNYFFRRFKPYQTILENNGIPTKEQASETILSAQAKGFKTAWSHDNFLRSLNDIENHPSFKESVKNGIEYSNAGKLDSATKLGEEELQSETVDKIKEWLEKRESTLGKISAYLPRKYFAMIQRFDEAMGVTLDSVRLAMYDRLRTELIDQGFDPKKDKSEFEELAKRINTGTGRPNKFKNRNAQGAMDFVKETRVFGSPSYTLAKWQDLGVDVKNTGKTVIDTLRFKQLPVGTQRLMAGRAVRSYGALMLKYSILAYALGAVVSFDPDDDDFLKLRIPGSDFRWDLTSGNRSEIKLIGQIIKRGYERNLSGLGKNLFRYNLYKAHQAWQFTGGAITGKDSIGKEFSLKDPARYASLVAPMTWVEIVKNVHQYGIVKGSGAGVLQFIGIGASAYPDKEDKNQLKNDVRSGKKTKEEGIKDLQQQFTEGKITKKQLQAKKKVLNLSEVQEKAKNLDASKDSDFQKIEEFLQGIEDTDKQTVKQIMQKKMVNKLKDGGVKSRDDAKKLKVLITKYL